MSERNGANRLTVLIASPLEANCVKRIESTAPGRVDVAYEPSLLPIPRWPADHGGTPPTLSAADERHWRSLLASADIMFDFDWFEPAHMVRNTPRLRWVQATSAGVEGYIAQTHLGRTEVVVTTAAGVHALPLAEYALLGLLYVTKNVSQLRTWQATHNWEHRTTILLSGRRVLIIGLGHVGRQLARSCACLGLDVWGVDPQAIEPPSGVSKLVAREDLQTALPEVDALIIACPNTPQTHHMIGAPELGVLRDTAVVVNIGRGPVVDEPALVRSLQAHRLAGAVLDVFEQEPLPADSPLWDMDNVLISPHSVATVATENEAITDLFIDNLTRYLELRPLRNVFDGTRGF